MKKQITLLSLFLFTISSIAQTIYQDVVYLKNGSIIRGIIIEQVINKSIKIETRDKSIFIFTLDEVEKITKEMPKDKEEQNQNTSNGIGSITNIDFGWNSGVGFYGLDRFRLNISTSIKFNKYFSLGLGSGIRKYVDYSGVIIPLFLNARTNLSDKNVKPFIQFLAGYSFNPNNEWNNVGLILNPEFGLSFKTSKRTSLNFSIGYEMQQMDFVSLISRGIPVFVTSKENSGAICLNAGIMF